MNGGKKEISIDMKNDKDKDKQQRMKKQQKPKRGTPPLEYPWLLFRTGDKKGYLLCCTTFYKACFTGFPHNLGILTVFNCCHGWLIFSSTNNKFFLWNPVKSRLVQLPWLQLNPKQCIKHALLLSPADDDRIDHPNFTIMLFQQRTIHYCFLRDSRDKHWNWTSVSYGRDKPRFNLENTVVFNGSVYFEHFVSHELFCIKDVSPAAINITRYCQLPELSARDYYGGRLVESCGELFYIVISRTEFHSTISKVEAFRLDQVSLMWNKVTENDGRAFFFNQRYSVSSYDARRGDTKGGSLYYFSGDYMYTYSFADNSVATCLVYLQMNELRWSNLPILYLADTRLIDDPRVQMNLVETRPRGVNGRKRKEETDNLKSYEETNGVEGETLLYCYYPNDVINHIAKFLTPVDYLNFRSVSRTCRLLMPRIEWRKATIDSVYSPPLSPWFILIGGNQSNVYTFVDSELGGNYFMHIPPPLVGTKIIHSSNGWLLMHNEATRTCAFYNPFTTNIVELPETDFPFNETLSIGFSLSPPTSGCTVAAIQGGIIYVFRVGWEGWHTYPVEPINVPSFFSSGYSLVFHDGFFYVLGVDGCLGVIKVDDDRHISFYRVAAESCWCYFFTLQLFFLECDGKLLTVCISEGGVLVEVFALNEATTAWEKIDDLGNHTLYLCKSSSFSVPSAAKWMRNTIFFTRLHEDNIVYYSMDTKKYHTIAKKHDIIVKYSSTRELLLASWIKPSWS